MFIEVLLTVISKLKQNNIHQQHNGESFVIESSNEYYAFVILHNEVNEPFEIPIINFYIPLFCFCVSEYNQSPSKFLRLKLMPSLLSFFFGTLTFSKSNTYSNSTISFPKLIGRPTLSYPNPRRFSREKKNIPVFNDISKYTQIYVFLLTLCHLCHLQGYVRVFQRGLFPVFICGNL